MDNKKVADKVENVQVNSNREHDEAEDDKDDNPYNPFKEQREMIQMSQMNPQMNPQMAQMNPEMTQQPDPEPTAYDNEYTKNVSILNHSFFLSGSENAMRKFNLINELDNKYETAQVLPDYEQGSLYKIFS
jgi:hypothetical protein